MSAGEFVSIAGPSDAKSTLLALVAGIRAEPNACCLTANNGPGRERMMVPNNPHYFLADGAENVAYG